MKTDPHLQLIKSGKVFALYRYEPAPTMDALMTNRVSNYYIIHREYGTLEVAMDQLHIAVSNFNMLEKIIASLLAGRTLQEVGQDELMQKIVDSGMVVPAEEKKKFIQ